MGNGCESRWGKRRERERVRKTIDMELSILRFEEDAEKKKDKDAVHEKDRWVWK